MDSLQQPERGSDKTSPGFGDLPKDLLYSGLLLLGFAGFMVWDQLYWWGNREDYSFGYLVPLFAAYVLYDRWPILSGYFFQGARPGEVMRPASAGFFSQLFGGLAVAVFVGSLLLYGLGALLRSVTGPQNPASLAIAAGFAGITLSIVFMLSKTRADGEAMPLLNRLSLVMLFLFPALIWLLSAPLVSVLETKIRVALLTQVTIVVFNFLDLLGYEIERQGNVLILPMGKVGVEEACSGIRSLTACLFAGSFLAAVFLDRFWKKVALVGAAMVLAVLTNMLRSLFLTLWAYNYGSGAIDDHWHLPIFGDIGSVHDVTGLAILGVTCVGLLCLLPIFNFKLEYEEEVSDSSDSHAATSN
ncbi:MAG: exosortase/archaeosortase family protein [Coraliomargaritaceae bacterium]